MLIIRGIARGGPTPRQPGLSFFFGNGARAGALGGSGAGLGDGGGGGGGEGGAEVFGGSGFFGGALSPSLYLSSSKEQANPASHPPTTDCSAHPQLRPLSSFIATRLGSMPLGMGPGFGASSRWPVISIVGISMGEVSPPPVESPKSSSPPKSPPKSPHPPPSLPPPPPPPPPELSS